MIDDFTLEKIKNDLSLSLNEDEEKAFKELAYPIDVKTGEEAKVKAIFYILSGSLKVSINEGEKSLIICNLKDGDLAILKDDVIMMNTMLNITFTSSKDSKLVVIDKNLIKMLDRKEEFRSLLNTLLTKRLDIMIKALSDISFLPLRDRIHAYLLKNAENGIVKATHSEIAKDNATKREVVSRILKKMEKEGIIMQFKGFVKINPL